MPGAAAIRAVTLPGRIAVGVGTAAAEGAAFGFAQGNGVGDRLSNAAIGAGLSAPFGAVAPLVGPIFRRVGDYLRRPSRQIIAPPPLSGQEVLQQPINSPVFATSRDNQRFVRGFDGTEDLAMLPQVELGGTTIASLPVRLRRGELRHVDDPVHIQQAQAYGYTDGLHLTLDVTSNWTELRSSREGGLVLIRNFGQNGPGVFVELRPVAGGQYWQVRTSGMRTSDEFNRLSLIATRRLSEE